MSKYQICLESGAEFLKCADNFYLDENNNLVLTRYDDELAEGIFAIFKNWDAIHELEEDRIRVADRLPDSSNIKT